MKNRRAVGLLNPMRDKNLRQEPGGRRDDTSYHGLSRSLKVDVCWKEKINLVYICMRLINYVTGCRYDSTRVTDGRPF